MPPTEGREVILSERAFPSQLALLNPPTRSPLTLTQDGTTPEYQSLRAFFAIDLCDPSTVQRAPIGYVCGARTYVFRRSDQQTEGKAFFFSARGDHMDTEDGLSIAARRPYQAEFSPNGLLSGSEELLVLCVR